MSPRLLIGGEWDILAGQLAVKVSELVRMFPSQQIRSLLNFVCLRHHKHILRLHHNLETVYAMLKQLFTVKTKNL